MVCRIRGAKFVDVPVQGKSWPTERGYPAAILQEVFLANPDTRDHIPKAVTPAPALPVLTKPTIKVWVLTRDVNDQFCAVWATKPTIADLLHAGLRPSACEHVLRGPGRAFVEDEWFNLKELPA